MFDGGLARRYLPVIMQKIRIIALQYDGAGKAIEREKLTDVEKRAARFISKLPFRLRRIGTRMKSSSTRRKTGQCCVTGTREITDSSASAGLYTHFIEMKARHTFISASTSPASTDPNIDSNILGTVYNIAK